MRKEASVKLVIEVLKYVHRTAEESKLEWKDSVFPSAQHLAQVLKEWDVSAPYALRTPDGFAEAADDLLQTYTK